jgi:hypothetical protein
VVTAIRASRAPAPARRTASNHRVEHRIAHGGVFAIHGRDREQCGVEERARAGMGVRGRDDQRASANAARHETLAQPAHESLIHRDEVSGDPRHAGFSRVDDQGADRDFVEAALRGLEPERVRIEPRTSGTSRRRRNPP